MPDRKDILLRAAYDMLKKCADSPVVISPMETTVFYDEADCDGSCLMGDIAAELGLDSETEPLRDDEEDDREKVDLYTVDGQTMSGDTMYQLAVSLYGKKDFMITNSKAALVLRRNGHDVLKHT